MSYTNYYTSSRMLHASVPNIMGTRLDALLIGKGETELQEIWGEMEKEITGLHNILNRFDKSSEIFQINSKAAEAPVHVSDRLWNIITDCRKYYNITNGYFDISLGYMNDIVFDDERKSICFPFPGIYLDVGGYAKGYTLGIFSRQLSHYGIDCAFVNFGNSSVLAVGTHPYGDSWPVGIDNPYNGKQLKTVNLRNSSLSVSGNMPSHPQHIINPVTGKFADERKIVAIESSNPLDAEVLTTTLMIAEKDKEIKEISDKFDYNNIYVYSL